jgi:cell division protease FtsH
MSTSRNGRTNGADPGPPRHAWQAEETLVERRNRLRYRILRQFTFVRVAIVVFIIAALFDPLVMTFVVEVLVPALLFVVQIVAFLIFPYIVFFWFLGNARTYTIMPGAEGVSFADYRGQPELLDQAKQMVKLLRGVRVFEEAGGEPLNGLLLEGPPGTGKTWLAQAISTEAGVPFFFIDASSLQSMFVGIAPLKVSNLYRKARRASRDYGACIVFIDEIDAIGSRGGVSTIKRDESQESPSRFGAFTTRLPIMFGGGNISQMGLLSTLLIEMSGFSLEHGWMARKKNWFYRTILRRKPPKPEKRILTIGATNRIGALDPALLRPGRFDKKIHVDAPDMEGRRDIIEYYLSKMAHDDSMDPIILASETQFYTPADIKYVLNESLRYALFDGRTYMTYDDFRRAQPEHEFGLRHRIKTMTNEQRYRLAAHEAGHAMAVRLYMPQWRVARLTIISQGGALGYMLPRPAIEEYEYTSTYDFMMNRLRISVASKAAEIEYVGEGSQSLGVGFSISGGSDFGNIRTNLWRMQQAGMFGILGVTKEEQEEIRRLKEELFLMVLDETRHAMRTHREMGEALIKLLLEKEELHSEELETFFDHYGLYTPKVQLMPSPKNGATAQEQPAGRKDS